MNIVFSCNSIFNNSCALDYFECFINQFRLHNYFLGHLLVDVAVTAEGAVVLNVAGDLGDEVGGFEFLVEEADKIATIHEGR